MRQAISLTIADLHPGRMSWRVLLMRIVPAFVAGVAAASIQV